jgi:hypothetical protein
VVGSRGKLKYQLENSQRRSSNCGGDRRRRSEAGGDRTDDRAQPIAAFGNSDGDFQMLEYTSAGPGRHLALIVHHTDADREWAYDRGSHIGKLERGLDEAGARGWIVADMKRDWKTIYPPK